MPVDGVLLLIRPSKFAWMLMFACGSGLAQAQSTSTGETDERPIGPQSKIDWTFKFDAARGSFAFRNTVVIDSRENARVDFGTHWFEGSSFACGMVCLAYAY
jgi:hypothetical protein